MSSRKEGSAATPLKGPGGRGRASSAVKKAALAAPASAPSSPVTELDGARQVPRAPATAAAAKRTVSATSTTAGSSSSSSSSVDDGRGTGLFVARKEPSVVSNGHGHIGLGSATSSASSDAAGGGTRSGAHFHAQPVAATGTGRPPWWLLVATAAAVALLLLALGMRSNGSDSDVSAEGDDAMYDALWEEALGGNDTAGRYRRPERKLHGSLGGITRLVKSGRLASALSRLKRPLCGRCPPPSPRAAAGGGVPPNITSMDAAELALVELVARLSEAEVELSKERRALARDRARADALLTEAANVLASAQSAQAAAGGGGEGVVGIALAAQEAANDAAAKAGKHARELAELKKQSDLLSQRQEALASQLTSTSGMLGGRVDNVEAMLADVTARTNGMSDVVEGMRYAGEEMEARMEEVTNSTASAVAGVTSLREALDHDVSQVMLRLRAVNRSVVDGLTSLEAALTSGLAGKLDKGVHIDSLQTVTRLVGNFTGRMETRVGEADKRLAAAERALAVLSAQVASGSTSSEGGSKPAAGAGAETFAVVGASGDAVSSSIAAVGAQVSALTSTLSQLQSTAVTSAALDKALQAVRAEVGAVASAAASTTGGKGSEGAADSAAAAAQLTQLQQQVASLTGEVRALSSGLEGKAASASVKAMATSLTERLLAVNASLASLTDRLSAVEAAVNASTALLKATVGPDGTPASSPDALEAVVTSLRHELTGLLNATSDHLSRDLVAVRTQVERHVNGTAEDGITPAAGGWKAAVAALTSDFTALSTALAGVNASLSHSVDALRTEVAGLTSGLDDVSDDVSALSRALAGNASALSALGSDVADMDRDYSDQLAALETVPGRMDAAAAEVSRLRSQLLALNGSIIQMSDGLAGLQQQQKGGISGSGGDATAAAAAAEVAIVSRYLHRLLTSLGYANAAEALTSSLTATNVSADVDGSLFEMPSSPLLGSGLLPLSSSGVAVGPRAHLRVTRLGEAAEITDGLLPAYLQRLTSPARLSDVITLIDSALAIFAADGGVGLPDYAAAGAGAAVLGHSQLTSETWAKGKAAVAGAGGASAVPAAVALRDVSLGRGPMLALQPDTSLGQCWAMAGSKGSLGVRLSQPVVVTAITIDHSQAVLSQQGVPLSSSSGADDVSALLAAQLRHSSAPKHCTLYGLASLPTITATSGDNNTAAAEGDSNMAAVLDSRVHLGDFTYNASGPAVQTFVLPGTTPEQRRPFPGVQLVVKDNYGSERFTCLYRVRVHGHPPGRATAAAAAAGGAPQTVISPELA